MKKRGHGRERCERELTLTLVLRRTTLISVAGPTLSSARAPMMDELEVATGSGSFPTVAQASIETPHRGNERNNGTESVH